MPRSTTLAESVAATLRLAIRRGDYLSGERLVELTLARDLNVSQATVREALWVLEQEGWVVKKARRGVHVRAFEREEAEELYTLWAALEGLALEWAMQTMTGGELKGLRRFIDQAGRQASALDWYAALEAIFDFHAALVYLARKPQTAQLLGRLHNGGRLLENLRERRAPRGLHGWNDSLDRYRVLLGHIEGGECAHARRTLSDVLTDDCRAVVDCL